MNIWKIASRWSDEGIPSSSILDIFRKYQMVFAGRETNRIKNDVKIGDLVAISDGIKVVAIGKVLTSPKVLTEFKFDEDDLNSKRFNYEDWVIGFKVKLVDLSDEQKFDYNRGTFHAVHGEYKNKIKTLYDNFNKNFSINAKTCTLKYNNQHNGGTIFDINVKYIIPIYQRPYSWTNEQINKFISDIFISYWGNDGIIIEDSMFIGTMQLSEKKFITYNRHEQEVIDGQQRLTTFLVLLKILKIRFPLSQELKNISLDWLETRVNSGKQQEYLKEFLTDNLDQNSETLNKYLVNAQLISETLNEHLKNENGDNIDFEIERFAKHILSNIYFVVIETFAGLSKTLQIFNAINTTGLDLNAGDIFKIRMYEYLKDKKNCDESAFNDISELYERIDQKNAEFGLNVTNIREILGIYQYILISKYDLPNPLYSYGIDTFYERLFDSIFNINQWEHFKNLKDLELTLENINQIIDVRYHWKNKTYLTAEDACMVNLINWSRYGRYNILIYVFLFRYSKEDNLNEKLFIFIRQLSKLFMIFSIRFQKAINDIHKFVSSLSKQMISRSFEDVIQIINTKIGNLESHKYWYDLEDTLKGNIAYNYKLKNIICRLSAMLEENYTSRNEEEITLIKDKLFHRDIDIEHIQAYHDIEKEEREKIWQEWGNEINSLGNLVVLEQHINRKIKNYPYTEKKKEYMNSKYIAIKNIYDSNDEWSLQKSRERKDVLIQNILNYFFN